MSTRDQRTVYRDQLDDELKRIAREGTERLVSVTPDGEHIHHFVVVTETLDEPKKETR